MPCCGRPDGQVLAYVTQENSDAVLAYYKEQLPQEGWQIEEESQVKVDEVDKHRLIVARGDHRLQIDVWQDQIAVFLLSPSWNDMVAWGDWIDMSPYCPQPPDLAATGKY